MTLLGQDRRRGEVRAAAGRDEHRRVGQWAARRRRPRRGRRRQVVQPERLRHRHRRHRAVHRPVADPTSAAYAVALLNDPDRGSRWSGAGGRRRGGPAGAQRHGRRGDSARPPSTPRRTTGSPSSRTGPPNPDPNDPDQDPAGGRRGDRHRAGQGRAAAVLPAGVAALLERKINTALGAADGAAGLRVRVTAPPPPMGCASSATWTRGRPGGRRRRLHRRGGRRRR